MQKEEDEEGETVVREVEDQKVAVQKLRLNRLHHHRTLVKSFN